MPSDAIAAGEVTASVIVPHYNDLDNLAVCLALLRRSTLQAHRYEIIVADNNSTCDRTRLAEICETHGANLVPALIQGAAEARNAGVVASRGRDLAFLDSDCRPTAEWLEAGLTALSRAPLVGGRVEVGVADPAALTAAESFERIFAFNNERYVREERFSVTANLFTTRAVFHHVGGFLSNVSEDVEWGQRAAGLGYAWLYEPAALVVHPARRTWPELQRKWQRLSRESFALMRHRQHSRARWLLRQWLMLLETPRAMLKALGSREVTRVGERLKAAAILLRLRTWRFVEAHRLALSR